MDKATLEKFLQEYPASPLQKYHSIRSRRIKLRNFRRKLCAAKAEIYAALVADLNRDQMETLLAELIPLTAIIDYLIRQLPRLARPVSLAGSLMTWPASAKLYSEPYGRVLVVSTWNYPLLLSLEPALGAFAAGNSVILKLSPRSPHTNEVICRLLNESFSENEITAVTDEFSLEDMLHFRYDYIFVTGNAATGKAVMKKAAENLTPCTMELGGKNPCIVNADANLRLAARRIVWGKFFNAGQSCAAPDYLMVHKDVKEKFVNLLTREIRKMYGQSPLENNSIASMPDNASYQRIIELAAAGRLIAGGDRNPAKRMLEPTVIDRLPDDSPLFKEEIFGPILPIKEFSNENEILEHLSHRERPLAAYCFGGSDKFRRQLTWCYSCGAVVFDDVLLHFTNMHIPFGGVGASGFGAYHGEKSFTTFTHKKPVMKQSRFFDLPNRYQPHRKFIRKLLEFFCSVG